MKILASPTRVRRLVALCAVIGGCAMIAEAALPEGTRYVMIELLDSSNSWGQQIGAVAFERLE